MKVTIDAAGRIVVPKALRQSLGLKAGQPLEIRASDGRLEIEISRTPVQLRKRGKGVVAVPDAELPALMADRSARLWIAFGVESGLHQPGQDRYIGQPTDDDMGRQL